jgi:hypothetical protein
MKTTPRAGKKTGPPPLPIHKLRRHAVLVKYDDAEYARLRAIAAESGHEKLAPFLRYRSLAS